MTPANDAPVATGDSAIVAEGGMVVIDLAANDVDPDDCVLAMPGETIEAEVEAKPDGGEVGLESHHVSA